MLAWTIAAVCLVTSLILAWRLRKTLLRAQLAEQKAGRIERTLTAKVEETNRLRDGVLKAVDDALLVLDTNQRILFANPAAEALLGQNPVGETLIGAMRHPELEALIEDARVVGSGEGVERRIEYDRHILHARAIASQNNHNGPFEVLTLRDVTELQRLERARRDLVSNITHELSRPITSIGLLADTLLDVANRGKTKKTRKMAKDIRRETDTLTQLVQEIRDLSMIESGQMLVRLTPTDLLAIIQVCAEHLLALAENKHETIQIDVPEGIYVLADFTQIQRAINNILHNAIKFSPDGESIQVTASISNDEVIIAVSDHGPGIPKEELPRVFERFYQVDRARREGTGLGLAIVRHIVQAHGGRVWVESIEGQGATFYIALALAEPNP
jgi:two-component system phosphate regulon sensor histidine kinase PhoR